jgi:hypothetical protein
MRRVHGPELISNIIGKPGWNARRQAHRGQNRDRGEIARRYMPPQAWGNNGAAIRRNLWLDQPLYS